MVNRDTEYVRWYPLLWRLIEPVSLAPRWRPHWTAHDVNHLAVYLHFPFCVAPCDFCPFLKQPYDADGARTWADAVKKHLKLLADAGFLDGRKLRCVYWGGGTPSLATVQQVGDIMGTVRETADCSELAEVSMEALPRLGLADYLLALHEAAGVTRCSVGVQTFDTTLLKAWGARAAIGSLAPQLQRLMDRMTVSIDLMYGGPGQTQEGFRSDLQHAIDLGLDQVSAYEMALTPTEPLFHRTEAAAPDSGRPKEMFESALDLLPAAGLRQVLISDFARPGRHSVYQVEHWRSPQIEVLGLGPGAVSYFAGYQYANLASLRAYVSSLHQSRQPVLAGSAVTTDEELCRNFVLGIKALDLSVDVLEDANTPSVATMREGIALCKDRGWILETDGHCRLTRNGMWYLDNVSKAFYSRTMRNSPTPDEAELLAWTAQKSCGDFA